MNWLHRMIKRAKPVSSQFNLREQGSRGWRDRARIAATMIAALPDARKKELKIADVGCGDQKLREEIRTLIPAVHYHGFDLLPQSPEVAKLDISSQPLGARFDVAVLLGVLEYVDDVPSILRSLRQDCRYLIVSHSASDFRKNPRRSKRKLGWKTLMSEKAFALSLENAGFEIRERRLTPNRKTVIWACQ